MSFRVVGLSADVIAVGLIASARLYGVPPLSIWAAHKPYARKARSCAAAALISTLPRGRKAGGSAVIARMVGVSGPDVSPATLARVGISADHLLTIVEAMTSAGLDPAAIRVEAVNEAAEAPRRTVTAPAPPKAAGPSPHRGDPQNRFDPARLGRGRRPAPVVTSPNRRDTEIRYDTPGSSKPFDLGAQDAVLVRECMRQGGFPVIFEFEPAQGPKKIFWLNTAGQNWKHRR